MASRESSEQRRVWRLSDYQLDQIIGNLLRFGAIIAAVVVLVGGVAFLVRHGGEPAHYGVFTGESDGLRSVPTIVREAFSLNSRGVMQLGLLLLVATPIARVVMSLAGFALQRDYEYVVITAIVLGVLLFSLAGGRL